MRKKLLKLLREIEKGNVSNDVRESVISMYEPDDSYEEIMEYYRDLERNKLIQNDCEKYSGEEESYYMAREFLVFPNYRFIIGKIDDGVTPENSVRAELKRMESDNLIMIETQIAHMQVVDIDSSFGVRFYGKSWEVNTESIILTTKGRNKLEYLKHELFENPITKIISITALIVSVIALHTK